MKITKVETVSLTVPSRWIWGSRPHSFTFIRVDTDEGLYGWGESLLGFYMPELVPPLVDHFGRVILGKNPFEIEKLWRSMFVKAMRWGHVGPAVTVLGGIEIALWDILGKALNTPLFQLFGGAVHENLRCYASTGSPAYPIETTLKAYDGLKEKGYTAVKTVHGYMGRPAPLTIDGMIEEETDKFRRIRGHLGSDTDILLDPAAPFNRNPWSGDVALQMILALEEFNLLWVEQPVTPSRIEEYLRIRRAVKTPLAAGENGTTVEDFRPFFETRAIDIIQPDAVWCGGIGPCRKILAAAEVHGMRTAPHCFSGAVGLAANYHIALSDPGCFIVEMPTADNPLISDLVQSAFTFRDGFLYPTGKPGLGVEVPEELINRYPFVPGSGISHPGSPFPRPVPDDWQAPQGDILSWDTGGE